MQMQILGNVINEAVDSVPIENGGTGARTKETACDNLGLVSQSQVRQPNGIVVLGENSLISRNDLPPDVVNGDIPSLYGPTQVDINKTVAIYITNFSSDVEYTVTVIGGTFTRELDKIIFTAGPQVISGKVIVNERVFDILVSQPMPLKPSIVLPSGAGLVDLTQSTSFTSSAFIPGAPGDTHTGTEWQLSTDLNFTILHDSEVVDDVTSTAQGLTHWSTSGMKKNKVYYARVRYTANTGGQSLWSDVITLRTRFSFVPSKYMLDVTPMDVEADDVFGSMVAVNRDATVIAASSVAADVNGLYNQGAVYVFNRLGHQVTQIAKIVSGLFGAGAVNVQMTIPSGARIKLESDAPGWITETFTSTQNIALANGSTTVIITGKGSDGSVQQIPAQGNAAYPNGLPVYNPGQAASGPAGDPAYPSGLPPYNPGQPYVAGTPVYDWVKHESLFYNSTLAPLYDLPPGPGQPNPNDAKPTFTGVIGQRQFAYSNGPMQNNLYDNYWGPWIWEQSGTTGGQAYIAPSGNPAYPNGLPAYTTGNPYIPPTGNPAYPSGLPVYVAASTLQITGETAEIRINNQRYTFPGGVGGPAVESSYVIKSLLGENFGYSLGMSDDGRYVAAAADTIIPKKRDTTVNVSSGGNVRFQTDSPDLNLITYISDAQFNLPNDATTVTMTGKGDPGSRDIASPAFNQPLVGSGTTNIPSRITSITLRGKGQDGYVIPQDWKFLAGGKAYRGNGESAKRGSGNTGWVVANADAGPSPIVYTDSRISKFFVESPYGGGGDVTEIADFVLRADGSCRYQNEYFGQPADTTGNIGILNAVSGCSASEQTLNDIFPMYILGQNGSLWYCTGVNTAILLSSAPAGETWVDIQSLGFIQGYQYETLVLLAASGKYTTFTGVNATQWNTPVLAQQPLPNTETWKKLARRNSNSVYAMAESGEFYLLYLDSHSAARLTKFPDGTPVALAYAGPDYLGGGYLCCMTESGRIKSYQTDSNTWLYETVLPQRENTVVTGATSTATVNGQTYTFAGGVGLPAVLREEIIPLPGNAMMPFLYNSPAGTLINLAYVALDEGVTVGQSTFVIIGVQVYEFPGGAGGPAELTTRVVDLASEPGAGAVIVCQLTDGAQTGQKTLLPDSGAANQLFGNAIDFDRTGNRLAIASVGYNGNQGRVIIYTRVNENWVEEETLTAADHLAGDAFGTSVALSENGDILIVGAAGKNTNKGAVYVFKRTGTAWSQITKITSANTALNALVGPEGFGRSVDISNAVNGTYMFIVGAPLTTTNGVAECGAAYTFLYTPATDVCVSNAVFTQGAGNTDPYTSFGDSVTINAEQTIISIGASRADHTSINSGVIYTFATNSSGVWLKDTDLVFPSIDTFDYHGTSLALSLDGGYLVTSAPYHNTFKPIAGGNMVLNVSPGGSVRVQTNSPSLVDTTYTTDQQIAIPSDATNISISGKGDPAGGSYHPQSGLPEYPNGLPFYNPGQAYVAPTGYVPGNETYSWGSGTIVSHVKQYSWQSVITGGPNGTPSGPGQVTSWYEYGYADSDPQFVWYAQYQATSYLSGGTPGYYTNPGQAYIAPTGNPLYPSGLPAYAAAYTDYTPGLDTTVTLGTQTLVFPGSMTGPAVMTTRTFDLSAGDISGNNTGLITLYEQP